MIRTKITRIYLYRMFENYLDIGGSRIFIVFRNKWYILTIIMIIIIL